MAGPAALYLLTSVRLRLRPGGGGLRRGRGAGGWASRHVLSIGAVLALAVSGAVLLAPYLAEPLGRTISTGQLPALPGAPVPAPALALSRSDLETVLSYVRDLRPDDGLVQFRAGVFAKRSNVQGVQVNGRTVYYDLVGDQSFGPLRTGKLPAAAVTILGREARGDALVLIYAPKEATGRR